MTEREIFVAALDLPDPAARAAYLERARAGDAGLRAKVDALLRSHDAAGSFLGNPAVEPADPAHAGTRAYTPGVDPTANTIGGADGDEPDDALAFLTPSARPDSLGRIGHYEVLQVLGKGGFGIVFRAFDDILQRVVAVKVMAPQLAATSPARKRFLREARSSAQVRHENVVQVYEVAEQPLPYLAMEFIPGETLQQRLDRVGPVDAAEIVRVGRQIAEGLAAAHACDLIHRDIKPGNVLIEGGQHRVKITDFGLARAADDASISQSGIIAGTPMYMAPEQALGQKLDQRADLFSLGSVLYQMAAGRPPFRAAGTVAVLKRVAEDTPRDIREIIPETPQWLCDIIAKLHAKNPDERYQSAREVADVLADCEAQLKANSKLKDYSRIPRGKAAPTRSGRRKWVAAAVVLFAITLLAVPAAGVLTYLLTEVPPKSGPGVPGGESTPGVPQPDGFVSLFNGKDLTGWKRHPDQPGNWTVEDGVLIGRGPNASHLFSDRGDFVDFEIRVEAKINNGGDSGLFFRSEYGASVFVPRFQKSVPRGYEAQICYTDVPAWKTSSLIGSDESGTAVALQPILTNAIRPDEWFTMGVVAQGNRFQVRVNGNTLVDCPDAARRYSRGHIALQVFDATAVVQFRKIEVRELPAGPAVLPPAFTNGIGMEFVGVPKGKAWLGGGKDRPGDREVDIPADFYLGRYEVTQEEWQKVMGENPSHFSRTGAGQDAVKGIEDADLKRFPVESVSWDDCRRFVEKLNAKEKEAGWVYRLPTEAEWEYACRGGPMAGKADSAFDFYFDRPTDAPLPGHANYNQGLGRSCRTGLFRANRLGLFDMHGNVWEWCADGPASDAKDATKRVGRGGGWNEVRDACSATIRFVGLPSEKDINHGLRLARVPAGTTAPEAKAPAAAPAWAVLKPAEMKSDGGATLKLQADDSVLVSGEHPAKDSYTLTVRDAPATIHALRLEVLPHASLPKNGPGRHPDMTFVLSGLKAELEPPGKAGPAAGLKLAKAWADHSTGPDSLPPLAIDGDDGTGWSAEFDRPHVLVVELAEPVAVPAGAVLRVSLEFKHDDDQRQLGCFRLSAASTPQPAPTP